MLLAVLVVPTGCEPTGGSSIKITNRSADTSSQWSEDLFSFALENLNHLEDNDCEEMLRSTEQRLVALQQPNEFPGLLPPDSLLASWPEPDMLHQVVSRLNQWVDTQEKPSEPKLDPMLATLPADLAKLPMVENLRQARYTAYDGYMLMEAVWLRDASRSKWAGGDSADELRVARRLFDWVVRNIQADYDGPDHVAQVPWETLFLGHGTAMERAWTYILLLRQRGIDAALLALPENSSAEKPSAKSSLKPWCVGVLIGDKEKRVYLFDPFLALPIPAPGGVAADKSGQLEIQPATLDQVVANPKLLDRLALGGDEPYWPEKGDLKQVVALIEASPMYVSPRAKRIQLRLTGELRLVLNAEPSRQKARFEAAGVGHSRLWELPYTTLQRRLALKSTAVYERLAVYAPFMCSPSPPLYVGPAAPLYKGRIMHLKGRLFDEKEAVAYYQKARPQIKALQSELPKITKDRFDALSEHFKPSDHDLSPDKMNILKQEAGLQAQLLVNAIIQGKLDASYWLGLIQYERGQFDAAMDYFKNRTFQFGPRVFWATGASYNIARTLEASGKWQDAIGLYENNLLLKYDSGSQIRARWLKELNGVKNNNPEEKMPAAVKPEAVKAETAKSGIVTPVAAKPQTAKP